MEFERMFQDYCKTSAAQYYAIGFKLDGMVYLFITKQLKQKWVKLDKDSSAKGGALKLRMNLSMMDKGAMRNAGAFKIGQYAEILKGNKNKGMQWEAFLTEWLQATQSKPNTPYYQAGDIQINNTEIQIKWENASLATFKTIEKALQ